MAGKAVRCPEGHFYDTLKHTVCPWCGPKISDPVATPVAEPTRAFQDVVAPVAPPIQAPTRRYVGDEEATAGFDPVVGWLVCTAGPDRGRDYRIRTGKNFIGRSPAMTIAITGDESVSRENHATIIFDPKKQAFWLQPGDASGLVYLNGDLLHAPGRLSDGDKIEVGQTTLLIVPLCGDNFQW